MPPESLVVVDATALVYRAYHAGADHTAQDGRQVGAVLTLSQTVSRWVSRAKSRHFAIVFDPPGVSFRHAIDPAYKASRKTPPQDLVDQVALAQQMTEALGLATFCLPGFEADDLAATLTRAARDAGLSVWLVSPDKDLFQLVEDAAPTVRVFRPKQKVVVDDAKVHEILGVGAAHVVDYQSLVGDSSDDVAGIKGIGPKAAAALITAFGGLDAIYTDLERVKHLELRGSARLHDLLQTGRDAASHARTLLALRPDAPIEGIEDIRARTRWVGPTTAAPTVFRELGFRRALDTLTYLSTSRQNG
ncbi:MAG: DNA polymerase-1 [Myxococcota bacterium]|jgi:DNA polymerase-1